VIAKLGVLEVLDEKPNLTMDGIFLPIEHKFGFSPI